MMRARWSDLAACADGCEVEITGWPASAVPGATAEYFLLSPEPSCCIGCLPTDPAATVEVFADAPVELGARALALRGRWRLLRDDPTGWRYQLLAARARHEPARFGRRGLLAAGPLLCLAACVPSPTWAQEAAADERRKVAARDLIARAATVDMHSHAGSVIGVRRVREHAPLTPVAEPMRQGGLAVVCLAMVADSPTHRVMADRRIHPYRTPEPGELYAWSQLGFQRVHDLVRQDRLALILDIAALDAARAGTPSAVVAAEGGDFLEGLPDRVDEAYERWGLRHLQLTHYRPNELGDIQTEAPVHGGLTDAGAEIIRRCNRRGLVVDVAHGTYDLVKRAAAVTTKPLVLSHTSLSNAPKLRSRLISPDHARAIAGTGGVIGIWPPAGIFPDLPALAAGMARMVEVVGIDHVGLGSDMMGLVGASAFESYAMLPDFAAALLGAGFSAEETGKLLGGNYARVFRTSLA